MYWRWYALLFCWLKTRIYKNTANAGLPEFHYKSLLSDPSFVVYPCHSLTQWLTNSCCWDLIDVTLAVQDANAYLKVLHQNELYLTALQKKQFWVLLNIWDHTLFHTKAPQFPQTSTLCLYNVLTLIWFWSTGMIRLFTYGLGAPSRTCSPSQCWPGAPCWGRREPGRWPGCSASCCWSPPCTPQGASCPASCFAPVKKFKFN